jgi:hypothetical protein
MKKRRSDSEFDKHMDVVRKFFVANATKYGFNMTWFSDVFLPLLMAWITAFTNYLDPAKRTHAVIVAKNKARKAIEPKFSQMVEIIRNTPDITDEELASIDIPRRKPGGKPLPVPPFPPDFRFDTSAPGWITIYVLNPTNMKHGRPPGAKGCIVMYEITDIDPVDKEKMANRLYVSSGKARLEFNIESLRGKRVKVCGCWVNTVGDHGPWSDIFTVIIP